MDNSSLRAQLASLTGIEHVVIDDDSGDIWLMLRSDIDPDRAIDSASELAPGRNVAVAFRPDQRDRQRVRFLGLHRTVLADQQVSFEVTLEWNGGEYVGTANGDRGDALELRTAAAAALAAVGSIVPGDLTIRLAGVKQIRAFDAEMVVISLYRSDSQPHNLVGAVVAGDDPRRAAATAVLNALNRLLGNFLVLP